jgi:hypothetical protein
MGRSSPNWGNSWPRLQHTDVAVPIYSTAEWTWAKGAMQTVDRPYGSLLNLLHHGLGSTHVCHHLTHASRTSTPGAAIPCLGSACQSWCATSPHRSTRPFGGWPATAAPCSATSAMGRLGTGASALLQWVGPRLLGFTVISACFDVGADPYPADGER